MLCVIHAGSIWHYQGCFLQTFTEACIFMINLDCYCFENKISKFAYFFSSFSLKPLSVSVSVKQLFWQCEMWRSSLIWLLYVIFLSGWFCFTVIIEHKFRKQKKREHRYWDLSIIKFFFLYLYFQGEYWKHKWILLNMISISCYSLPF